MTLAEAIAGARAEDEHRKGAGFNQMALEEAARQGFANGAFEESEEEGASVMEEFYPDEFDSGTKSNSASKETKPVLADKLNQKAAQLNGGVASVPVTLAARSEDRD